jgi:hypothetical protein
MLWLLSCCSGSSSCRHCGSVFFFVWYSQYLELSDESFWYTPTVAVSWRALSCLSDGEGALLGWHVAYDVGIVEEDDSGEFICCIDDFACNNVTDLDAF